MNDTAPPATQPDLPASLQRLVLTGFMGSGKTTIGRLLAARLGWRFLDLDAEIERQQGRTVADIFAAGEPAFRHLETEALRSSLCDSRVVIALGGGAVETPANLDLLTSSGQTLTIFLTASFDTLYERCLRQKLNPKAAIRPLLGDPISAAKRLAHRDALYKTMASLVIDTSAQTPHQTTDTLLRSLQTPL